MKTKFTKVSVEERLPEEIDTNTVFFTKKGNVRIFYNEKYIKDYEPNYEEEELEYFLEESPDREDEMREMLERMKINLLFTSEIGFGNRLTSDELERYTKEIDELLEK